MSFSFLDLLQNRKSCREFVHRMIIADEDETLIRWAAKRANYASGGPRVKIFSSYPCQELTDACVGQKHVDSCGLAFLFAALDTSARMRSLHRKYIFDCDRACFAAELMAQHLGYGACTIGNFYPVQAMNVFSVPSGMVPVLILVVGHEIGRRITD